MWWIVLPVKTFAFTDMFVFKIDTFANEIMGLSCYGRKSTPLRKVGKSAVILFCQLYELIETGSFQAGKPIAVFAVISPPFQDAYTCCQFSGVLIAGRPNFFPLALAAAMPSAWRCLMVSRSCSAMVPITSIRTGLT